ncbi:unnamed protein product [Arctia plantaginis]|uniref:MADF domain-containing protein n=1 Tax=Arctia plantaginis TaxID=874455 RepID=A0A8S1B0V8_ARCPL|nr:unnamed protein product [Arctia plantaginis]
MNENKPLNITEKLIHEVQNRPILWDRYNDYHHNRVATDREWLNLSLVLNTHKDILKQKWKNLRDQFQRELRKIPTPDGDSANSYLANYTGKWIYFEQMLFLKDSVKTKQYNHNIEEVEMPEDTIEELIVFEDEPLIKVEDDYSLNSKNPLLQPQNPVREFPSQGCTTDIVNSRHLEAEIDEEVGRKRKASEEPQDRTKRKKMSLAEDPERIDDDDLHFFKSLLPFMKKLTPIRKLIVRNEIQNILLRENLCDKCNGHSC